MCQSSVHLQFKTWSLPHVSTLYESSSERTYINTIRIKLEIKTND